MAAAGSTYICTARNRTSTLCALLKQAQIDFVRCIPFCTTPLIVGPVSPYKLHGPHGMYVTLHVTYTYTYMYVLSFFGLSIEKGKYVCTCVCNRKRYIQFVPFFSVKQKVQIPYSTYTCSTSHRGVASKCVFTHVISINDRSAMQHFPFLTCTCTHVHSPYACSVPNPNPSENEVARFHKHNTYGSKSPSIIDTLRRHCQQRTRHRGGGMRGSEPVSSPPPFLLGPALLGSLSQIESKCHSK